VGHGSRSIHGTVVHMGQDGHVAKVGHEGIRLPPQDPFDVHKGETYHMEQDARPDTKGVGAEELQGIGVADGVQAMGCTGEATHEKLNLVGGDKLGEARGLVEVDRQRGMWINPGIQELDAGQPAKQAMDAQHRTKGCAGGVGSKEAFLPVGPVFLGPKFDPKVGDGLVGNKGNAYAHNSAFGNCRHPESGDPLGTKRTENKQQLLVSSLVIPRPRTLPGL